MFTMTLLNTGKLYSQNRYSSPNELIKETQRRCIIKFYSEIKNNMVTFAGKWVELKTDMLNEIKQAWKDKYSMFSLTCRM